jgi:hypothetical protein
VVVTIADPVTRHDLNCTERDVRWAVIVLPPKQGAAFPGPLWLYERLGPCRAYPMAVALCAIGYAPCELASNPKSSSWRTGVLAA